MSCDKWCGDGLHELHGVYGMITEIMIAMTLYLLIEHKQ